MSWWVTPLEITDHDGNLIRKYRLTAKSDEGGPYGGNPSCYHDTAEEAKKCPKCRDYISGIIGFSLNDYKENSSNIEIGKLEKILKNLVALYIDFPDDKICKHWCALKVLEVMQMCNIEVSDELTKAIISVDEKALELLKH